MSQRKFGKPADREKISETPRYMITIALFKLFNTTYLDLHTTGMRGSARPEGPCGRAAKQFPDKAKKEKLLRAQICPHPIIKQ